MVLVSVWILWIRNGERAPRGKGLNLLDNVWGPQLGEGGWTLLPEAGPFQGPLHSHVGTWTGKTGTAGRTCGLSLQWMLPHSLAALG